MGEGQGCLGPEGQKEVRATARTRLIGFIKNGLTADRYEGSYPICWRNRPHGLKRLELVGDADGTAVDVMAEASPFDTSIALIPRYLKRIEKEDSYDTKARKPYVTMQITLTLQVAEQQLPKGMAGAHPSGTKVKKDERASPSRTRSVADCSEDAVSKWSQRS